MTWYSSESSFPIHSLVCSAVLAGTPPPVMNASVFASSLPVIRQQGVLLTVSSVGVLTSCNWLTTELCPAWGLLAGLESHPPWRIRTCPLLGSAISSHAP